MSVLIVAEQRNGILHQNLRAVLAAALKLDPQPVIMVIGHEVQSAAEQAACLPGVHQVLLADHACYAHMLPENVCQLISDHARNFEHLLMASTNLGKNVLPRVAAILDVAQVTDVTCIFDSVTVEHPIYAGNAIERVRILDAIKVFSIRTTAFNAVAGQQPPCQIQAIARETPQQGTQWVCEVPLESTRPALDQAKIVVSGGRGMQSAAQFALIEQLADRLGAAVGASRAAVDAGFISNEHQVGQTGYIVAPELYIAVGISGAIQHLAGMQDSKIIVAINQDPLAPIFSVATYGLVGDLFEILKQWIALDKEI